MTTNEILEKMKSMQPLMRVNSNNKSKIDSRKQFLKYGVQQTIQTLWSNFPKLQTEADDSNEELKSLKTAGNLLNFQLLETILYNSGIAALKDDFNVAEVLDYLEVKGEIKFLKTRLTFGNSTRPFVVFEEYNFDDNGKLIFNYSLVVPEKMDADEARKMLFNVFNYRPTVPVEIPYKIFYNNCLKVPDLALVNEEYFTLLNKDIEVLIKDSYLSAPWIFSIENASVKKQIEEGLEDLSKRFISLNPQLQMYDYDPLRILQSQSQSQIIIQKIEKNISWIKKFGYFKQDSSDFGTKNMHNVEAQEINSDFEDYIEAKANLRELQLLDFFNKFYKYLNINKVLIYGSTEWLITEARKYTVNQNGAQINSGMQSEENNNDNRGSFNDGTKTSKEDND